MKHTNSAINYYVIITLAIFFIIAISVYAKYRSETNQEQVYSDSIRIQNEQELKEKSVKKQDLILRKETLEKTIKVKQDEAQNYVNLAGTYCAYQTPTYVQQCEEYRRKGFDVIGEVESITIDLESIMNQINTLDHE